MILVAEPRLRTLLTGLLMLTGCRFFTIDPQQRPILFTDTLLDPEQINSSIPIITMDEMLSDSEADNYNDTKFGSLDRMNDEQLSKTTFIDFSDDLNHKPEQLMAMLEKVDKDSRLVRFKVVPNMICKDLKGRKTEPKDSRLDTIFICKQDSDPAEVDDQLPKYGLLRDAHRYDELASLNDSTVEFTLFEDGSEESIVSLARTLLDKSTNRHIKSLIGKPYCPAEYKRFDATKPGFSCSNSERGAIEFVLLELVVQQIIDILFFYCICACFLYIWSCFDPDEDELEGFKLAMGNLSRYIQH